MQLAPDSNFLPDEFLMKIRVECNIDVLKAIMGVFANAFDDEKEQVFSLS